MFKKTTIATAITISTSLLLVACGGGGDNNGAVISSTGSASSTGTLQGTPTPTAALTAAQFTGALQSSATGAALLQVNGETALPCGVAVSHIVYSTTGAAGEKTNASAAVMIPTGTGAQCTGTNGKLPVVLYAHGTTVDQTFNMANVLTNSESTLVAATFAAQGYIVIAPNYVGYDLPTSGSGPTTLPYHPYVNYKQQSQEMIDALNAGRASLSTISPSVSDSGKLFVTGYSEGGYVAMAALKAMDAAHIAVTAGAPMSGPYSLAAYGDAIFYGNTALGATEFAPLLTTGYQAAYGNIYSTTGQPADAYTSAYASNIASVLSNPTFAASLLNPANLPGLFQSVSGSNGDPTDPITGQDLKNSQFSFGFSADNYMIQTSYRAAYLADAAANPDGAVPTVTASPLPTTATPGNTLRQAFKLNDLRGYVPSMPVLMCGGNQDPTVFFSVNAQLMAGILSNIASAGAPVAFGLLDVDGTDPATSTATASTPASVGFSSSPALGAAVTGAISPVYSQLISGFDATVNSIGTAAGQALAANPPASVLTAANAAATTAATAAINNGNSAGAAAAGQAAATAVVTAAAQAAGKQAVAAEYHGTLVPPFCSAAAQTFFKQYL